MVMFRLRIMFHRSTFSAAINQNFDPHKLDCFRKKGKKNCTRAGIVINLFVKFFFSLLPYCFLVCFVLLCDNLILVIAPYANTPTTVQSQSPQLFPHVTREREKIPHRKVFLWHQVSPRWDEVLMEFRGDGGVGRRR